MHSIYDASESYSQTVVVGILAELLRNPTLSKLFGSSNQCPAQSIQNKFFRRLSGSFSLGPRDVNGCLEERGSGLAEPTGSLILDKPSRLKST